MALLIAAAALASSGPVVSALSQDFSGLLASSQNSVRSCEIVDRKDGEHLVISMNKDRDGDSIHIEYDTIDGAFDYIFDTSARRNRRYIVENSALSKLEQIDIPVRTATGLTEHGARRIFTKSGTYAIYIGFSFRSSDESQIFGACRVSVEVPQT
ncbi:hypothetical protein [Novosphingobium sp.]|uniref:hypothetical protein n=1 Tax=Novosphingobium sp. TaxID=1874826 RepID=UPI003BA912CB